MGRIIVIIPEKIWLNGIELAIPGKDSGQWRRIRKKSLAKIVPEIPKAAKVSDPDVGFEAGNSSCPRENQGARGNFLMMRYRSCPVRKTP
jgi:hypothetical protein